MEAPYVSVDITSSKFKCDPYPTYARWRDESPVVRVGLRGPAAGARQAYLVTRYEDVSALLRSDQYAKQAENAGLEIQKVPGFLRPLMRNMLALDDPDHARLKRLVQSAFNPRRTELLRSRAETISSELIDRLPSGEPFDLIRAYAFALPVAVISDMLGIPKQDRLRFARWSGALIEGSASHWHMVAAIPKILAFLRYLDRFIALKREQPDDDLVSELLRQQDEGDGLNDDELKAMVAILLNAGHETTTNLIGNGVLAVLDHPEAGEQWRTREIAPEKAVEEMLRFAGPVATSTHRYARHDVEIAGISIPRGSLVLGAIASANRDETQFRGAERLELGRAPNRHLTFGEGGHYCVGASLARMEGQIAFRQLMTRFPDLRLAAARDAIPYRKGLVLSGPEQCLVFAGKTAP